MHISADTQRQTLYHNFHHAAQSVRVVTLLEREGRGLNLTEEVREGILAHSDGQAWSRTQEGRVVRYADKIAYMNHDIEDAIRGGILTEEDLPWEVRLRFGSGKSRRISGMLQALIQHSGETVQMDEESERHFLTLKRFLFEAVYKNPVAKGEEGKARDIVRYLFAYYVANPHKLPDFYRSIAEEETPARAAADFISGMSDRYCVDILTQVSAIQSALNSFNKVLLSSHIKSCVVEDIRQGKEGAVDELCKTIQKLMK